MIKGTTLTTTVAEILDAANHKRDYVVPSPLVSMNGAMDLEWAASSGPASATPTVHAHGQIADYLGIPRRFYERIRSEVPDLITINVNRLMKEKAGDSRMIRTLRGDGRAVLSDRYRRLDYEDIAENLLPRVMNNSGLEVASMKVTESKFYMHLVAPRLEGEIRVGDPVRFGLVISSSEVGLGALAVQAFLERLRCTNGMVVPEYSQRRAHLGARLASEGEDFLVISDETQRLTDKALWAQIGDAIDAINCPEGFQRVMATLQERVNDKVPGDPQAVVKELANRFNFREDEQRSILYSFLREGDETRWGLANAVTELANENGNYDRAVELEKAGGEVMAISGNAWTALANAGN